jgi:cation diffusion facilitator CzcD-associated flavoprotein CzcO
MATHLIAAGTTALWVSVRRPATILPLEVAGVPLGPVAVALRRLPERMRDLTALGISRAVLGNLAPYGLPAPGIGPYRRLRTTGVTAAVDRGFARHLRAGRLRVVAQVDRFDGNDVVLRDGTRLRPDVVLLATGFRTGLEPLAGHLGVVDPAGIPLGRPGTPAPGVPGLWFVGYRVAIEGNLRLHRLEARRIARAVARQR